MFNEVILFLFYDNQGEYLQLRAVYITTLSKHRAIIHQIEDEDIIEH